MTEFLFIVLKKLMFGLFASSMTGEHGPSEFKFSKVKEGNAINPQKVQEFMLLLRLQVLQDE